jgi:hypothetical protein
MARLLPPRHLRASLIFDPEDAYARRRGVRGLHPRPIGPLVYRARGPSRNGDPEPSAPELVLRMRRNPSGFDLNFGEAALPDGTRHKLEEGTYTVRILSRSGLYEPVELRDVALPRSGAAYQVDLEPGANYPFPSETLPGLRGPTLLRGTYRRPDGQGIARATVQVPGVSSTSRTGPDGQWVLVFPDDQLSGPVTVRFTAEPGAPSEDAANVPVVAGRTTSLRETVLRGWTLTSAGAPLAGVTVEVSGLPPVLSEADGAWTAYFGVTQQDTDVSVTASLPDGRSATQPNVHVTARDTTPVPTFRL